MTQRSRLGAAAVLVFVAGLGSGAILTHQPQQVVVTSAVDPAASFVVSLPVLTPTDGLRATIDLPEPSASTLPSFVAPDQPTPTTQPVTTGHPVGPAPTSPPNTPHQTAKPTVTPRPVATPEPTPDPTPDPVAVWTHSGSGSSLCAVGSHVSSLSNGSVSPSAGAEGTVFQFSVTYTDSREEPPVYVHVIVDGVERNIGPVEVGAGSHTYAFKAEASSGCVVSL